MVMCKLEPSSSSLRLSLRRPNENNKASKSSLTSSRVLKRSPSLKMAPSLSPTSFSDNEEEEFEEEENQQVVGLLDGMIESETIYPPATSQVAQLNRELKALETRYFRTRLQLEKATSKNDQLRQEMKKIRTDQTQTTKEVAKAKHLIDRIQSEKRQLELQAINNRDYAKKIEQRFFMGTNKGQSLAQKNIELFTRIQQLEQEKVHLLNEKDTIEQDQKNLLQEHFILKKALEIRFDELTIGNSSGNVHHGILLELSKLQEDKKLLIEQLTKERQQCQLLEHQVHELTQKDVQNQQECVVFEQLKTQFEKEKLSLQTKIHHLTNIEQNFDIEKETMLKFIQQQAEHKFCLENQLKEIQNNHFTEIRTLQENATQLQVVKEKLTNQIDLLHQDTEIQRQTSLTLEKALTQEQQMNLQLTSQLEQRHVDIQELDVKMKEKELFCQEITHLLKDQETQNMYLQTKQNDLLHQIEQRELNVQELTVKLTQKDEEMSILKGEMENALKDLQHLSKQRNEAAKAMNEAVTISASSLEEQQNLEKKIIFQQKQMDQLKISKNLLQKAMLEQLGTLRKQLQLERINRIEVESKLKQLTGHEAIGVSNANATAAAIAASVAAVSDHTTSITDSTGATTTATTATTASATAAAAAKAALVSIGTEFGMIPMMPLPSPSPPKPSPTPLLPDVTQYLNAFREELRHLSDLSENEEEEEDEEDNEEDLEAELVQEIKQTTTVQREREEQLRKLEQLKIQAAATATATASATASATATTSLSSASSSSSSRYPMSPSNNSSSSTTNEQVSLLELAEQ